MKLPEYTPDGSLPPVPGEPVLGSELERRYGISKAAFHKRRNAVPSVVGNRQGRFVYFSPEEIFTLDAVHYYLVQQFSLEDIATAYSEGQSNVSSPKTISTGGAIDVESRTDQSELSTVSPSMRDFSNEMAKHIAEAITQFQPPTDPLRPMRLLEEASEKGWSVSSKMLSNILEMKLSTVHSFPSKIDRHGFQMTKVGPGKWVVERAEGELPAAA